MIDRHGTDGNGKRIDQVVYYQPGVGTGRMSKLSSVIQGATGAGLEENVATAYHFIATNYSSGADNEDGVADEIFVFGFSRGAYTVRALAGMVTEMGLLRPHELCRFGDLYKVYSAYGNTKPGDRCHDKFWKCAVETARKVTETLGDKMQLLEGDSDAKLIDRHVKIKVVGVWDTVGSRGLPESIFTSMTRWNEGFQFHDTALNNKVRHAFHALSLDEHRGAFRPTMWYLNPKFGTDTDLKQCWFPGYHADIGGGTTNRNSRDESEIDEITLAWMCDQVDGLLQFNKEACAKILTKPDPDTWAQGKIHDPIGLYRFAVAGGNVERTPGQYNKNLDKKEGTGQYIRGFDKKGRAINYQTNETIHPSVRFRMENPGKDDKYDPPAFKGHTGWRNKKGDAWDFIERKGGIEGNGAMWVRPETQAVAASWILWRYETKGEREVKLDEWVIREAQGRNNFV